MIIDAQIHLWPPNTPDRPWAPGQAAHLPEPMTAERFVPMMDAIGVDRAVIAPPNVAGFDPSYALECHAAYPQRFGVMGRFDMTDWSFFDRLPHWNTVPGMLGLRLGVFPGDIERWTARGALPRFWDDCERYDIALALFLPNGVGGLADVAERHPGLRLIIDHLNLTGATPQTRGHRVVELIALARYPNVAVKASALPLFASDPYPFAELHEPILRVYDAFGPRRLFWGSDQTMQLARGRATYAENINLFREALADRLPPDDLRLILGVGLAIWLRWLEPRAPTPTR
ncbi:MAG: amidohydrolase [Dehalococcoidia bacterium]|nr:amidohydrolase [Dehalococcoidia bacterium]